MDPVTTIEPADAVDATASAATPATPDPGPPAPAAPADPAASRRSALLGAVIGAAAGLLAIAALFAIARLTGLSEWVGLALIVGEDGVFSPSTGVPLAWAVPPLAAAVIGALTGPAAARGVRWSGWWMGYLTYGLGIVIGALVLVLLPTGVIGSSTDVQVGPLDLVVGVLVLVVVGAIIAAPVLVMCVLAGIAWAAVVRRLRPADVGVDPGGRPIIVMGVVAGVLALLWLTITTFLDVLVNSQLD